MASSSRIPAAESVEQKLAGQDYSSQQPKASRKSQLQNVETQKTDDTKKVVGCWRQNVILHDLRYMKKTTLIEMRPGLKEEGNVTFVLISRESVSHCKSIGTSFIISNYDDNKTRFVFPVTTTLPIAIHSNENEIGLLDYENGVKYDIFIDFHELTGTANDGNILALYDVRYEYNGESGAEILIKPGQVTFKFDVAFPSVYKALSIVYGINRALNIHKPDVMQCTQPPVLHAEGFLSLYEGIFPLLTEGVMRAASRGTDEGIYQLTYVDFRDGIQDGNKIAMIVNCDRARKMCTAFDLSGNQLFHAIELVGTTHVMHVTQQTRCIGKCQWSEAEDAAAQLKLYNGDVFKCSVVPGYDKKYVVVDSRDDVVCRMIDSKLHPYMAVIIKFFKNLQTNAKIVILSYAIKLAFEVFQLQQNCVPRIKLSQFGNSMDQVSTFSSRSYLLEANGEVLNQLVPAGIVFHSDGWRNYMFRAAGYDIISGTHYCDVIGDEYEVYLTMEIHPTSPINEYGMLKAKNQDGFTLFAVPNFRKENMMSLYNEAGNLLGYQIGKTFHAPSGKVLMTVHEKDDKHNLSDHQYLFTANGNAVAHIDESAFILTLTVKTSTFHTECSKYLLLAYTMKLRHILQLTKIAVPQIEYKYLGENSDIKEY